MKDLLKKVFSSQQTQRCPNCDVPLEAAAINIQEGVALCPDCGQLTRLSELNYCRRSEAEILGSVPPGCRIDSDGQVLHLMISNRSIPGFLMCCVFGTFWNGIVCVFLMQVLAGVYYNMFGPLPAWFPAFGGKNGVPLVNDEPMTVGVTLGMALFLVPFVAVGLGIVFAALFSLAGRVVVTLEETSASVATGIGFLRWRRRFDPRQVQSIYFGRAKNSEDTPKNNIEILADKKLEFGSTLPRERAEWAWVVLKNILLQRPIQHPIPDIVPPYWLQRRA
jgi:hypothetical protein